MTGCAGAIKMKRAIVGLLTAGLFLCAAATGSADEITIDSGNVNVPSTNLLTFATFDLIGSGFEISGSAGAAVLTNCLPCSGGAQGREIGVGWIGADFGNGPATVGGHNYGN